MCFTLYLLELAHFLAHFFGLHAQTCNLDVSVCVDHIVYRMLWLLIPCLEWTYVSSLNLTKTFDLLLHGLQTLYCAMYILLALYLNYVTSRYFHTPEECIIGLIVGAVLLFGVVYLGVVYLCQTKVSIFTANDQKKSS